MAGRSAWSGEDGDRLERDLAVLGDDAEPDRAALVLRAQLALVHLQLGDEVLERDLVGVAGGALGHQVLGVDALVVIGLGLLRERREVRIGRRRRGALPLSLPLLELDAARDDRVALVVELLLAGLGAAEQA